MLVVLYMSFDCANRLSKTPGGIQSSHDLNLNYQHIQHDMLVLLGVTLSVILHSFCPSLNGASMQRLLVSLIPFARTNYLYLPCIAIQTIINHLNSYTTRYNSHSYMFSVLPSCVLYLAACLLFCNCIVSLILCHFSE